MAEEQKEFLDIPGLSHLWAGLKTKLAKKDLSNVDAATGRSALGIKNPDWNQNDTDAVDFVKNRTHWIEDLIVPYAQYAVDATYHRAIIEQGGLRDGEKYTVTWEGTQYECTAIKQNVLYTILGDDGVVPFKIQASSSRMYVYPTDTTLTAVNMGIKGPGAFHPLSENFLPVIPVSKGGTGASSVAGAQEALGIGGKRTTRLTIGTSTSGWAAKDCDYLCDGEADDVEINAAIDSLPEDGGEIVLLDGSYYLTDDIDVGTAGVTIRGNGQATKLVRAADGVTMINIRYGGCTVEDLYLEGLIETYTGSSNCGIYIGPDNNIIRGCTITGNTSYGIQCWGAHNMISENTISKSYTGINILEDYNVVSNNVVLSNTENGINVQHGHNIITGNVSRLNAVANLRLMSANYCVVVGNDCSITADDEVTAQYAIQLYRTDNSNNIVTENLVGSGSITDDGGTGNVTGYASAGYGYGEQMVWLGLDTTTSTFQEQLEALFTSMPTRTCMQVQVFDTVGLNDNKWSGTLWKYTANYGYLSVANYRGLRAFKYLNSGNWSIWLRDNPFGTYGTEYASMERWDGDIVYRKVISVGKLANAGEITVSVPDAVKMLSINGYINKGNYYIPICTANCGISSIYYASNTNLLHITTNADRSDYNCYLELKYTK